MCSIVQPQEEQSYDASLSQMIYIEAPYPTHTNEEAEVMTSEEEQNYDHSKTLIVT